MLLRQANDPALKACMRRLLKIPARLWLPGIVIRQTAARG